MSDFSFIWFSANHFIKPCQKQEISQQDQNKREMVSFSVLQKVQISLSLKCYCDQNILFLISPDIKTTSPKQQLCQILSQNSKEKSVKYPCNFALKPSAITRIRNVRVWKKDWVENGTDVIVTTKTLKTWLIQYAEWKFSLRKMGVF